MEDTTITRVGIVEDIDEVRTSLIQKVNGSPNFKCVCNFNSGESAVKGLIKYKPEIIIMDIGLPQMSGVECMLRVKKEYNNFQFLMFTVFDHDEKVFDALKAGANGYILKKDGTKGVIDALSVLTHGGAPMSPVIARKVLDSFHQPLSSENYADKLTSRETEILRLLAKGLLYKEIAIQLRPPITVGGLKQNINRIYKKLEANNRTEAINKYLGGNRF